MTHVNLLPASCLETKRRPESGRSGSSTAKCSSRARYRKGHMAPVVAIESGHVIGKASQFTRSRGDVLALRADAKRRGRMGIQGAREHEPVFPGQSTFALEQAQVRTMAGTAIGSVPDKKIHPMPV